MEYTLGHHTAFCIFVTGGFFKTFDGEYCMVQEYLSIFKVVNLKRATENNHFCKKKEDCCLSVGKGNSGAEQSEVWDIVGKVGKLGKVTIGVGQALEFRL